MIYNSISEIPVLIIAYKRYDTVVRVLNAVEKVQPRNLYVAFNAPDPGRKGDQGKCDRVRKLFEQIGWPCSVVKLVRQEHLSARDSITGAISWFFSMVESGIILEDDCVPGMNFFYFCLTTLNKYKDDEKVMHISGNNFLGMDRKPGESYYFSNYCHIWGWAGWKRAWNAYDPGITLMKARDFEKAIIPHLGRSMDNKYWLDIFRYLKSGNADTWDTQWLFSIWKNKGFSITPASNLVENIGFGKDATNTILKTKTPLPEKLDDENAQITHPHNREINEQADVMTSDRLYRIKNRMRTFNLKIKISRHLPVAFKSKIKSLLAFLD
ncbi:MAG TPA: hypothetical protein VI583_07415 [Cyclobacteriaceae bacterium]|nr:hypothetical protein [Cyclobacteriaceae bacterium]